MAPGFHCNGNGARGQAVRRNGRSEGEEVVGGEEGEKGEEEEQFDEAEAALEGPDEVGSGGDAVDKVDAEGDAEVSPTACVG